MRPLNILCLPLSLAMMSWADHGKQGPEFNNIAGAATVTVNIQFNGAPDSKALAALGVQGAAQTKSFKHVAAGTFTIPASAAKAIAALPQVKYMAMDRPVHSHLDITAATVSANLAYQYGWTGQGIGVAVIDSGIGNSADLGNSNGYGYPGGGRSQSRVVYSDSLVGGTPADAYGHGTHVAGIIAGNGSNSNGKKKTFRGIAPQVNLINLRALDQNGVGTDSSVIAAIDEAIDLKNLYNIRVINLSLGRPIYESFQTDPLCQAVEAAWNAGIVVVVAAGNNGRDNSVGNQGYGTINSPANDPYVITVGAMKTEGTTTRADDLIASYSSKGPTIGDHIVKPDILAPGTLVSSLRAPGSTLDSQFPQNRVQPASYGAMGYPVYFTLSGTSMAAPVVSGAAALLLQKSPNLTPDQVKARLMKTASKTFPRLSTATDPTTGITYTDYYDIFTVGAGYLDIYAALNNSDLAPGSAISPTAIYNSATKSVVIVADSAPYATSIAWGSSIAWGDSVIWGKINLLGSQSIAWGNSIAWGESIAWGTSIAWGDSTTQGFNAIWNSSIAWGDSSPVTEQAVLGYGEN